MPCIGFAGHEHIAIHMILTLELPPPLNQCYKVGSGTLYKTEKAKQWQSDAGWLAKSVRHPRITGDVGVRMKIYYRNHRDIDSSEKLLFDAMQHIVYENDRQIVHKEVWLIEDVQFPRLEVEFYTEGKK